MTWLALRALFGGMFSKLWTWLSGRSFWQLVCIGLAIFAIIQHFALLAAHRHERKADAQIVKLTTQLKAISTAKNQQIVQTKTRIVSVVKTIHDADQRAKIVETAPPAPNCKTNSEVLGADL